MNLKPWHKFFIHLVLFIFEKSFKYLHQYFDLVYEIDDDSISILEKGCDLGETSSGENS